MHLSVAAVAGARSPKTFCLSGDIQGNPLSILLDSGSSHSFVSMALAGSLSGVQQLSPAVTVQVANGAVLSCDSHIPAASWSVQGYSFTTDLKLLPLSSYDMILGLDWMSHFSPMQVDWSQQWICIPYQGQSVYLWGNMAALPAGSIVQLSIVLKTLQPKHSSVRPVVQPLLDEFAHLFTPPLGLPPSRNCDHTIPLIAGAQPVFVRPY